MVRSQPTVTQLRGKGREKRGDPTGSPLFFCTYPTPVPRRPYLPNYTHARTPRPYLTPVPLFMEASGIEPECTPCSREPFGMSKPFAPCN